MGILAFFNISKFYVTLLYYLNNQNFICDLMSGRTNSTKLATFLSNMKCIPVVFPRPKPRTMRNLIYTVSFLDGHTLRGLSLAYVRCQHHYS